MILQPGKDKEQHSSTVSFVQAVGKYSSCCSVFETTEARAKCLNRKVKNKSKTRGKSYLSFSLGKCSRTVCEYTIHRACVGMHLEGEEVTCNC